MNEADFHRYVDQRLRERFESVEHEHYLPSQRFVDFVAEGWLFTLAIEVEYNPEDVLDDVIKGAGQAVQYAGEIESNRNVGVVPVVICNRDALDLDAPEVEAIRNRMPLVPLAPSKAEDTA